VLSEVLGIESLKEFCMGLEVKIAYTVLVFFEVYLELKENKKNHSVG